MIVVPHHPTLIVPDHSSRIVHTIALFGRAVKSWLFLKMIPVPKVGVSMSGGAILIKGRRRGSYGGWRVEWSSLARRKTASEPIKSHLSTPRKTSAPVIRSVSSLGTVRPVERQIGRLGELHKWMMVYLGGPSFFFFVSRTYCTPCGSICINVQPSLHVGPVFSSKMIPVPQSWAIVCVAMFAQLQSRVLPTRNRGRWCGSR